MRKLGSLINTHKTFEIDSVNDNNDDTLLQEWQVNNDSSLL